MKIAHVVSTFSPHFGGMGSVCEDEADGLADDDHEVTVFTLRYPNTDYQSNFFLFNVERLLPWIKMGDAGLLPQLTRRLRDFDIIHLHYPFYGGAEWVWLAKLLYRKKYIVTYHMTASPSGVVKRSIQRIYDCFWQKRILLGAEKVLVVDKNYWLNLPISKEIPVERVVELTNGISLKTFCSGSIDWEEIDLNSYRDKKIILFVGNLLPLKRLDLLIKSLARIKNDDWRLVVVGGGYAEAEYKKLVSELGLNDKVKFIGYCFDREKLAKYYRAAWVTVLPTDNESFSLVAAESLSCGTPVILAAGSGGSNRIKIGESGLCFTPGSESSLSQVLSEALNLSGADKNTWGENGQKSVADYDFKKHIEKLQKIYMEIDYEK